MVGLPCNRCTAVEASLIAVPWCPGVMEAQAVSGAPSGWHSTRPDKKTETIATAAAARIIVM